MNRFRLSVFVLPLLCGAASAQGHLALSTDLCYRKGNGIFVQRAGQAPEKWMDAKQVADAKLAPAGDAIAFTYDTTRAKSLDGPVRHLAILDGKGAKPRVLEAVPGANSYGPLWSPDGQWLLFQNYERKQWRTAVIGRDGKGFRVVYEPKDGAIISQGCWAPDGKSCYLFDFEFLYQVDLAGKVLRRLAFQDLGLEVEASDCQFQISGDGKRMLVETEIEVDDLKNEDHPSPVIFLLDLPGATPVAKARRVSPKGMMLSSPVWMKDGKSFVALREDRSAKGLWQVDLDTGKARLIVPGATDPSAAR